MQIKATMIYYLLPISMDILKKKKKKISSVVEGVEKIELPYDTEILLLNIYPKEMKSILQRAMYYI